MSAAPLPGLLLPQGSGLDPSEIGPGFAGFLAIFVIALASWLLFRSMNRHLRRVRHSPDPAADDDTTQDGDARKPDGPTQDGVPPPGDPRR